VTYCYEHEIIIFNIDKGRGVSWPAERLSDSLKDRALHGVTWVSYLYVYHDSI
jgi:hypothetical protein